MFFHTYYSKKGGMLYDVAECVDPFLIYRKGFHTDKGSHFYQYMDI